MHKPASSANRMRVIACSPRMSGRVGSRGVGRILSICRNIRGPHLSKGSYVSRNTKIVATLGPACSSPAVMSRMLAAGVDVVRLNFSHGTAADHIERARLVRECAQKLGREVGIMADL